MITPVEVLTVVNYRRAYARAKVEGIRLRPVWSQRGTPIGGLYYATSAATGQVAYLTDARPGSLGCTCPAGENGKFCKHLAAAMSASGTHYVAIPALLDRPLVNKNAARALARAA